MRRISIVLTALCCIRAPAPLRAQEPAAPAPPAHELDADERAVLRAVVDYISSSRSFVVLEDSTRGDSLYTGIAGALVRLGLEKGAADEMIRDYTARNAVPVAVPPDLSPERKIRTYNWNAYEADSNPRKDSVMLVRFAPARSFHGLTRPGFDRGHATAIVGAGYWCEGLCGYFGLLLLRRERDGWKVVGGLPISVS